jgi:hypothetical protein
LLHGKSGAALLLLLLLFDDTVLFVAFILAVLLAGRGLSARVWAWGGDPREAPGPFERAASTGILAFAAAVAIDWALALLHGFTRWAIVAASAALLLAFRRSLGVSGLRGLGRLSRQDALLVACAVEPFVLWIVYVLVRSTVVFPFAQDALSYHLPKALFVVRAHAFAFFDGPDLRLSAFPANYEMLLADAICLTGSDKLTGAVGVLAYVLFGFVVAGMTERWWGRGLWHVVAATMLALAMPTVVVGCGAHKNDILLATCLLAAAQWTSRWAVHGERAALLLALVASMFAVGTKVNGGVLAFSLLPAVVWRVRAWRRGGGAPSPREVALWLGGCVGLFVLLGGAVYVVNVVHLGHLVPIIAPYGYGDWKNLWMFPYLAFARPLSGSASWVPWKHAHWYWPEWDFNFSTYGLASTLALLAMPFAIARYRSVGRSTERALATVALAVTWLAVLPMRVDQHPVGFFEGFVRYTAFFPVALLLWTAAPAVRELTTRDAARAWRAVAALGPALVYAYVALHAADDPYVPASFVGAAIADPKLSRTIRTWTTRAGSWVDANAAPDDVVAFDGAFDAWIYPAFGATFGRRLVFLHSDGRGPVAIDDDVRWVAIDRSWHCVFGNPQFTDFSVWDEFILRGEPLPEDLAVYQQLLGDPRFELVYRDARTNQAVFRRVAPR